MDKYTLVIVESPAKAKTIEKYLGSDYRVASSVGHIRDLPKQGMNVDLENDFQPTYEVSSGSKKVVAELKKLAKPAKEVILASDEDREGEAIAWHICHVLGLDPKTTKRIVFHEITKSAILDALKSPRFVQQSLVDAQQARRVLDRIVGYEMSPILWKKLRPGLSAGRVQSIAVKLINEREHAIQSFKPESHFKVQADFQADEGTLAATLQDKLVTQDRANDFLNQCKSAKFHVADINRKPGQQNPSAPFTTSTLQQIAARRLGYSVRQTMRVAQKLYETGHITYMRTDSVNLGNQAAQAIASYIKTEYGERYLAQRQYKSKTKGAQEAHEAIRPTDCAKTDVGRDDREKKLYRLIWQRTVASQMSAAKFQLTKLKIGNDFGSAVFLAEGKVLNFDGWLKVYGGAQDDVILADVKADQPLAVVVMVAQETFSKPPARFSEASLVRQLEEMGIGRPSTYAPTISTIQDRGYVEKKEVPHKERVAVCLTLKHQKITCEETKQNYGQDKNKLLPTALAEVVTPFLDACFGEIMDYGFTSTVEANFDKIAQGKLTWTDSIKEFYKRFHPLVEAAETVSRDQVSGMREVGIDKSDGKMIYARMGRYGPMLQKGKAEDSEEKPVFASLPKDATIAAITLKEALPMFELPRIVGTTEDNREIKANIGRFGPYVQVDKLFVSIKDLDPATISLEEARELIADKEAGLKQKIIKEFSGLQVLNGRYGPYITDGKKNAPLPKNTDADKLTKAQAKKILAEYQPKHRGRGRR